MEQHDIPSTLPRQRRAPRACTRCNSRKVRCDVSRVPHGAQCTNCHLDNQPCTIRPRVSHRQLLGPRFKPFVSPRIDKTDHLTHLAKLRTSRYPDLQQQPQDDPSSAEEVVEQTTDARSIDFCSYSSKIGRHISEDQLSPVYRAPGLDGHLLFSYFDFLKLEKLSSLSSDDAQSLEMSGSLHIPTRPTLDLFVREYFLHVAPNLPMVDERHFWRIYKDQEGVTEKAGQLSLFLFQAMLFAASSSVPVSVLKRVGFRSVREARKTFYRRAKNLFDLEAERDPYTIAQGALLLSYYSTISERHSNTFWLRVAIRSAREAEAHRYNEDKTLSLHDKKMKKRLWWSCLLRDRILPLGLRRPLQISHSQFDCRGGGLTTDDFSEDIGMSEVYNPETQRALIKIIIAQCELAVEMTDVITFLYPSESNLPATSFSNEDFDQVTKLISKLQARLGIWYKAVHSWVSDIPKDAHASITLYSSLMYMYYHAVCLALCHRKILVLELCHSAEDWDLASYAVHLETFRSELRTPAAAITCIVQNLLHLDLAKHMPISAMAYAALPLVLSALDLKISSMDHYGAPKMGSNPLEAYTKTMKYFNNQFDGTEEVSSAMDRILLDAETQSRKLVLPPKITSSSSSTSAGKDWYEIFLHHPKLHLRIALAFDLGFSTGKFPADEDFPQQLRSDQLENEQSKFQYSQLNLLSFEGNRIDERGSSGISLPVTRTPEQHILPRSDLDFMDLSVEDFDVGSMSGTGDIDFLDIFEDATDQDGFVENAWEHVIMELFDQPIPG